MSESNIKVKLEGIVTVGKRGQFVLPKDLRQRVPISPDDKLALITLKNNNICSIILANSRLFNL